VQAVGESSHGDNLLGGDDDCTVGWASVIRNVVVGRLRATDDPDQRAADFAKLHEGLAGIAALQLPGLLAMNVGCDLGLRDGGCTFAITNDWQDADAYRVYDAEEEHNRLRREIFAVICEDIARVQFRIDR
jgi:Stress responsive A/B Barrel Domain